MIFWTLSPMVCTIREAGFLSTTFSSDTVHILVWAVPWTSGFTARIFFSISNTPTLACDTSRLTGPRQARQKVVRVSLGIVYLLLSNPALAPHDADDTL